MRADELHSQEDQQKLMYPNEPSRFTGHDLDALLLFCVNHEASDITLQTNERVLADIHGRLYRVSGRGSRGVDGIARPP